MTPSTHEFGTHEVPSEYQGENVQSLYITMRDGVRLAAEVVLPAKLQPEDKIPTLLIQTRYWRAMELRAPFKYFLKPENLNARFKDMRPFFTSRGYAVITVDIRGTGASFGIWNYPWHTDSLKDAYEIVDWIVSQPWSNGKVGAYGGSYLGTTAEMLAMCGHPAVKAIIPMFNHPDAYTDIAFPGGLFNDRFIRYWGQMDHDLDDYIIPGSLGFIARLLVQGVKPVDEDKDRQLLQAAIQDHTANGNVYETARSVTFRDEQVKAVNANIEDMAVHRYKDQILQSGVALCGWASWMDAGTANAAIRRFLTFDNNPMAVIGAWDHSGQMNASPYRPPEAPTSPKPEAQWAEMVGFLDVYLKDTPNDGCEGKYLYYYTMGEEKWHTTPVWPPEGIQTERWYLAEDHGLSLDKPIEDTGADEYTVDFQATTGEQNRWWEMGVLEEKTVVYSDRAAAAQHLLTYTTPPLDSDTEITGYPIITLYVTSTEADGAFYVYLEDVDENGNVTYITEGQLRAIHRQVSDDTSPYNLQTPYHTFKQSDNLPLIPNEIAELTFGLNPTSVLIRKGHSLRFGIAGHDSGTFPKIPEEGTPVITVARNSQHASHIDLPVILRS